MAHPLHVLVNDFALRSLRETADKDYVHARLAYRSRLVPQFLWSALHCLEKYVKCVLVLNRIDARRVKHEVTASLNKLRDEGKFQIDLSARVLDFVQKLESGARFRYYETSYLSEYVELLQLDKAVWEIRRYCQPMDYDLEVDGRKVNQLAMNLERVRTARLAEERGTCITGGWLEQVIAKPTHEAREALLWKNLFFGHSRGKSVKLQTFEEAGNSPLFLYPEIVDEVAKYVYLPEEVKVAYRELYAQRLAGEA